MIYMKVNFIIMNFMVKENIDGKMVENIKEIGKIIKCMVKENFIGQMELYIKDSIRRIKSMVKEL